MNNMKFDLHLNVGKVYRTEKPGSVEMFYSGKEIAEYVNYFNITHAVCIYDQYENLKELMDNTNAKIYGVQWIVDNDQELDFGKEGWYGIKLHSHRGYRSGKKYDWKHPKKKSDEELSFGLDYGDKYVTNIIERLPNGSLVYIHTQGWPSIDNRATPQHLFMLATEFMNLKFIMGHAGMYGGMNSALPGPHVPKIGRHKGFELYKQSIRNYGNSVIQFKSAVHYANMLHNLFLDSSCYTPDKAIAFRDTDKWCIGSDYPFGANKPRNSDSNEEGIHFTIEDFSKPYNWNFDKQYTLFANAVGKDNVDKSFESAFKFIESPLEQLALEQFEKIKEHKLKINKEKDHYK